MSETHNDADLQVLEAALGEELGRDTPPDLWPRLQATLRRGNARDAGDATRPRRGRVGIAVAALAAVVVVAVLVERGREPLPPTNAPPVVPAHAQGGDPAQLAELQSWLAEHRIDAAMVRVADVVTAPSGASAPARVHELDGLFEFGTSESIVFAERAELARLLTAARADAGPIGGGFEHQVQLRIGTHAAGLLARGRGADRQFAVATTGAPVRIALDAAVADLLEPAFADATAATIAARGIAIGDAGLAAMPATITRLRPHGVSATAVEQIGRFAALRALDLRFEPAWTTAAALRRLAGRQLDSLCVAPAALDADATAVLAQFRGLRELFVAGPDAMRAEHLLAPAVPVAGDLAGAVAQLGSLEELMVNANNFGARELARLAALPNLRRLALVGCAPDASRGIGALAAVPLEDLAVMGPVPAPDAAQLAGLARLRSLTLCCDVALPELARIVALPPLRRLSLRPAVPFADGDLVHLYGARQLTRLELLDCDGLSAGARAALAAALPGCRVAYDRLP